MSVLLLETAPPSIRRPAGRHPGAEKRTLFHDVSWEQYKSMQRYVETWGGGRVSYLDGLLEHITLSLEHENKKCVVGQLLELFLDEEGVTFFSHGSATLEKARKRAGKEPDESYCFLRQNRERPDLVIEIAISRPALKTLEIYRRFAVPEVWIWQDDRLHVFHLEAERYTTAKTSRWFPTLDLARLETCARMESDSAARKAFRASLRRRR
jgi:Uma2 family endonuclease